MQIPHTVSLLSMHAGFTTVLYVTHSHIQTEKAGATLKHIFAKHKKTITDMYIH